MRSFNIYIIFTSFIIYFLTGYTSFCQPDEHLVFRKIDEQNGLSDNNVQCIYKDKNNFVWIHQFIHEINNGGQNFEEVIIFSLLQMLISI